MSEAQEGCAWLEDVEESTFVRFSQFAYTGDYIAADPEILLDSSNIASAPSEPPPIHTDRPVAVTPSEPPPPIHTDRPAAVPPSEPPPPAEHAWPVTPEESVAFEELDGQAEPPVDSERLFDWNRDTWRPNITSKKKKGKAIKSTNLENLDVHTEGSPSSSRREKLWKIFESISYSVPKPSNHSFHPRKNLESCEDYKDVFLCHARLYVFAEKYDIAPLKKLSLSKLHKTLSVFTLWMERVGDIVALMRYSYANTVYRSPSNDPLRLLVIHYATCVVEQLVKSSEFKALLEEPGELASDLVVKMIHRLD